MLTGTTLNSVPVTTASAKSVPMETPKTETPKVETKTTLDEGKGELKDPSTPVVAFSIGSSLSSSSSSLPATDPMTVALQTYYRTKSHLPSLLTEHAQPITDINLSIIEYQLHAKRHKEKKEGKETQGDEKALTHYETLHNVSHPIPVADIFDKALGAEGKLTTKPAKRLLILGSAGIGKTTMSQYLAHQWAGEKSGRTNLIMSFGFRCVI